MKLLLVARFFIATKVFLATGTIVPIPIPCAGLPLEAGLIRLLGGTEGVSDADAEWGLVLRATTGGKVRMRSGKIDWRVIKIRGRTDRLGHVGRFLCPALTV